MFHVEHFDRLEHTVTTIRRAELDRLAAIVAEPHEHALLLTGEPGSGKSTLLNGIHPDGYAVHRARVSASERDIPYSGLSAIAASFDDPAVANLSATLLARTGTAPAPSVAAAAFLTLLRAAGSSPGVLIIDDADLMDPESRAVLSMIAGRLGGTGLHLVAAMSSEQRADLLGAIPRFRLESLDADQSMHVASALTDHRADRAVRNIIVGAARGNARALAEIASRLSEEQLVRAAPIELPFRLSPASAETDVEPLIATLSSAHLHSAAAIGAEDPDALERLLSDGVVTRERGYVHLTDPVLRSRVYWSMPLDRRRLLHEQAELAERDHDAGLACWHASLRDQSSTAATTLAAAAARFAHAGHTWQAVELAERALAHGQPTGTLAAPLLDLASACFLHGEPAYAERYARWSRRTSPGHETHAPVSLIRVLSTFVATRRLSLDTPDYAMLVARGNEDAPQLTQLAAVHAERWEHAEASRLLDRAAAVRAPAPVEAPGPANLHDLVRMQVAALAGDAAPAKALIARIGGRHRPGTASTIELLMLGRSLTFLDRNHDARQALRAVLSAEPAPAPLLEEYARAYLTELEIRAGRQLEATALIERNRHARGRADHPLEQMLLAWRRLALGDVDLDIAELHRQFAFDDPAIAARLAVYQGQAALAEGRFDDAVAVLKTAAAAGAAFPNPSLLRYDVDLVEAYAATGRHEEALAQARDFARRAEPFATPWTRQAGARIAALLAPGEESLIAFDRALRLATPPDLMFERARTFMSWAERLAGLGRASEADEHRRAARAVFTQLGTVQWITRTEHARPVASSRPAHPVLSTLSDDERRVVDLVRQGLRNKEIAAMLYVSLRTVEVRLTRIYQRLGIGSRAQLISALAEAGAEPAVLPRSG
ncbi:helix-turn-helix transcriptional regulator [Agromyces aerolatus]|uniref:helix-turn-helix transcriptional regulator n=1 Tax=Agromyces sp. LY-1074 TaxID=3074080 RepID=UPI00285C7F08|nr:MULTISPECIES: AAA family ATPase [unclassified Agromyces]MDR5698289.1 AAA family ATPase [Agromyces sp. LY-1074]MDR5704583.1 AAA family ATPase [Agromyces sp. LY-1358]